MKTLSPMLIGNLFLVYCTYYYIHYMNMVQYVNELENTRFFVASESRHMNLLQMYNLNFAILISTHSHSQPFEYWDDKRPNSIKSHCGLRPLLHAKNTGPQMVWMSSFPESSFKRGRDREIGEKNLKKNH